ncbi:mechanosensitive ion channel [Synechocystis salina LEGE 06099]|uniref:mechanosensitive ion channel n=1 Tax=Synechocystis salina TaxID=945780 RepID=UPI0018812922|nr:mechanosensitive ion channel [Synechocystis salina]MBE9204359.1 mechanosensitive ion channel [Synechocystis salina LEGE 06099]
MFRSGIFLELPILPKTAPLLGQIAGDTANIVGVAGENLTESLIGLGKALVILIVGWLVANICRSITTKAFQKTHLDNILAAKFLDSDEAKTPPVERWLGDFAFWIVILFTLVAFFNALDLEAVSEPLNGLLEQITVFFPRIIGALILGALAWAIATLVKLVSSKALGESGLSQKLGLTSPPDDQEKASDSLGETIGSALYWFIFLLFLPSILNTLGLQGTLEPVQGLLDQILLVLPNVLGAVIIGTVGWVVAKIVSQVVTNLADGIGIDSLGERFGLRGGEGRQNLADILGVFVYVLILIPVAITALDALQINAISEPATAMLDQVMALLPKLFAASVVMVLAFVAGQYVANLVSSLLSSIGFDNLFELLGFNLNSPQDSVDQSVEVEGEPKANLPAGVALKTPSQLGGIIVLVGIMLVATLTAVDILQIAALTTVMGVILQVAAQVLIGLVIFTFGLYLANLAFKLITSTGTHQSRLLGHTARISILVLVSAMALQQMGIAPNIVNLAFGLLTGGIAVAIALAFGLGGREVAGEKLREWLDSFDEDK